MPDQMWEWLDKFPQQIEHAFTLGEAWDLSELRQPQAVAFLGIGGSAIGADLIADLYRSDLSCPVVVSRSDITPAWLKEDNLVVAISYSGETRETLNAYRRALQIGAQILSVSSGGSLARLAEEQGLSHLLIPGGMAPRAALGYISIPLIFVLQKVGVIPPKKLNFDPLIRLLESLRIVWNREPGPGIDDARKILDQQLPLIVGGGLTSGIARRFQAQLAENAKTISIRFEIPEALHNLVETLTVETVKSSHLVVFYLEDPQASKQVRCHLEHLREFIQSSGIEGITLYAEGDTPLERLYTLIYKTDWISYHLAKLKGIDPVAIPIIASIKEKHPTGTA